MVDPPLLTPGLEWPKELRSPIRPDRPDLPTSDIHDSKAEVTASMFRDHNFLVLIYPEARSVISSQCFPSHFISVQTFSMGSIRSINASTVRFEGSWVRQGTHLQHICRISLDILGHHTLLLAILSILSSPAWLMCSLANTSFLAG